MNTQDVYKNVHKIQVNDSTRDGILGLIDIQTNSGIQKVLDKIDALDNKIDALDTKIDAVETKMGAMETRLESKIDSVRTELKTEIDKNKTDLKGQINIANVIAVGVGLVIIGNFISQVMKK